MITSMVTFLLFVAALGALIVAGYRINIYLFTRGVVANRSRGSESVTIDGLPIIGAQAMAKRQKDEGMHYARIGFLAIAGFVILLGLATLGVLNSVFH